MKIPQLAAFLFALTLCACVTRYTTPPEPRDGRATISGSHSYTSPFFAESAYISGYDGTLFDLKSPSLDLEAGRRRLALGASHKPGIQSFAEVTVTLEARKRYSVTSELKDDGLCHYRVLEYASKKEIGQTVSPAVPYSSKMTSKRYFLSKGWHFD